MKPKRQKQINDFDLINRKQRKKETKYKHIRNHSNGKSNKQKYQQQENNHFENTLNNNDN